MDEAALKNLKGAHRALQSIHTKSKTMPELDHDEVLLTCGYALAQLEEGLKQLGVLTPEEETKLVHQFVQLRT